MTIEHGRHVMEKQQDGDWQEKVPNGSLALPIVFLLGLHLVSAAFSPQLAQEAYYAEYAAHPALSYLDHPPMVAWGIHLGQAIFGYTGLGLRLGSLLFLLGTWYFGLSLLREWGGKKGSQKQFTYALLAIPLLAFGASLAMPDSPLITFWTATVYFLWLARTRSLRYFVPAGIAAGLCLLSKYTAVFLLPGGVLVLLFDAKLRQSLKSPWPYLAVLLSALCFLPVVIWNANHEWASFLFQTESRYDETELTFRWLLQFLGGQVLGLTPWIVFALVLGCLRYLRLLRKDPRSLWILGFGLPLPIFMLCQTPWTHVKLNWILPAYIPLVLGAILASQELSWSKQRPRFSRGLRRFAFLCILLVPLSPLMDLLPRSWGNSWSGWTEIAQKVRMDEDQLDAEDGVPGNVFAFAASTKDASMLAQSMRRVLERTGKTSRVLAQNALGDTALSFDLWTHVADLVGQSAVFVARVRRREPDLERIRARFRTVDLLRTVEVRRFGIVVQEARLYACRGYHMGD